jgi:bla regulator protein blaR1
MSVLVAIAVKSLLIAGISLGLLALMKRRSAAERSTVAHLGLFALVLLAFVPVALPNWTVEAPALLCNAAVQPAIDQLAARTIHAGTTPAAANSPSVASASTPAGLSISASAAATAAYAIPAAVLLFITFLALMRLIALRARADILVDGHWLSALARAQRRMGFKHGTALLTSNELSSPVSWGLMRPVILLNSRAVEASGEAEAIIAHELAHVARMDWAKLLLARVTTALFWFNPLVWALAREAHQLREETADDTVLAADIPDTDYAQLLVGVARHECPGLLLGAHGVAPSRNSLARRVARVLDTASVRGPAARPFALGLFAGAILIAAPLAALTLTPGGVSATKGSTVGATDRSSRRQDVLAPQAAASTPADLPHLIAQGVATSVNAAATLAPRLNDIVLQSADGSRIVTRQGETEMRSANGETMAVSAPDANGRRRVVMDGPNGRLVAYAAAGVPSPPIPPAPLRVNTSVDDLIALKTVGVSPDYISTMRAAAPQLRNAAPGEFAGLKAVGVTPEFARGLVAAGLRNITANELEQARAVGVDGAYVSELTAAGLTTSLDNYMQLRSVGVPPDFVRSLRDAGYSLRDPTDVIRMWSVGVRARDLRSVPRPPTPPRPPPIPDSDGG